MKRSILKRRAKKAYYRNFMACIAISFLFTLLVGGTIVSFHNDIKYDSEFKVPSINKIPEASNSEIVNEFIKEITNDDVPNFKNIENTNNGVIGPVINNISKSGSYVFGILNAINEGLFKDRIWPSIIIIIGVLVSLIYSIFVSKVLEIGKARFYIENRKFIKTKASKIAYPYKINKTLHIAWIMLVKRIYNMLWGLTIVGGVIKHYSYYLVPYILAENPNLKTKEVIKLSRDMMDGYKWFTFKLELSFLGWQILGMITFNIGNIIFTNPYLDATMAELYMYLRDLSKTKDITNSNLLNDTTLEGEIEFNEYPISNYNIKEKNNWVNYNYNRNYSILNLILLFFIFSMIGFIWEVLLCLFERGILVNRGTLHGPWLPIYGAGGITMLVLLKNWRKNPFLYFSLSMLICGIIEYFTSVYLEMAHNLAWWDYTGFFLNLNGRVCLEGLIIFGLGGLIVTYIGAPIFANYLDKIPKKIKIIISTILIVLISIDFYISGKYPNTGNGVTIDLSSNYVNIINTQLHV